MEIPLTFDAEFFDILLDDVISLDTLQSSEQKILGDEIEALSQEVTAVTKYGIFPATAHSLHAKCKMLTRNT